MEYLQKLAVSVNMPFVNITLDVGAAMNAYKMIWNNEIKFSNIVIDLGGFHFIKENFQVIGDIMSGSGFEDVAFQANIGTSGSLRGVMSGSHYNRAWIVHTGELITYLPCIKLTNLQCLLFFVCEFKEQ